MKEYIEATKFLTWPEKSQRILIDWWQPKFGDLASFKGIDRHNLGKEEDYCFVNNYDKELEEDQYEDSFGIQLYNMFTIGNDASQYIFNFKSKYDVIPLLSVEKLERFIGDKGFRIREITRGKYTDKWYAKVSINDGFSIKNYGGSDSLLELLSEVALDITEQLSN